MVLNRRTNEVPDEEVHNVFVVYNTDARSRNTVRRELLLLLLWSSRSAVVSEARLVRTKKQSVEVINRRCCAAGANVKSNKRARRSK